MIAAIPTRYQGYQFRSRLEAKWACFFDLVNWRWEYEPVDMNGWIPDFVIKSAEKPVYVEIKPYYAYSEWLKVFKKIRKTYPKREDYYPPLDCKIMSHGGKDCSYLSCQWEHQAKYKKEHQEYLWDIPNILLLGVGLMDCGHKGFSHGIVNRDAFWFEPALFSINGDVSFIGGGAHNGTHYPADWIKGRDFDNDENGWKDVFNIESLYHTPSPRVEMFWREACNIVQWQKPLAVYE